ncbi:MAG: hypothetical protein RLZZ188_2528 [Verrucomicrobiota bacterium]|jgi:hypothetical protein
MQIARTETRGPGPSRVGRVIAAAVGAAAAAALVAIGTRPAPDFSGWGPGRTGVAIVVPRDATPAERRAGDTVRSTFVKASGLSERHFPLAKEGWLAPRRAVEIGMTRRGAVARPKGGQPPHDNAVAFAVADGTLVIAAERREAIEGAAGWFLAETLGARWYLPGPLGEEVPSRAEFALPPGRKETRPAFVHRDLGLDGTAGNRIWYARNGLEARFEHGHNLREIYRTEDLEREPDLAPMRNGQRFVPPGWSANWQPNLLSPAAVRLAAEAATRAFDRDPRRLSFSLSINDTDLYDESPATLAAVAPARFFRNRPDYSPLVFGFANAVARAVAVKHPDRWLPAYAYYWCENTPGFPVERNVVPFLTADRSQWSHAAFRVEDRALIERWCRSGAEIVGVYDYFHGTPNLAPRPTLYAVADSIPFQHRAGVRAYFAETYSNWALDGPKAWLAAQLLWDPTRDPAALLDRYHREFWREAEGPMRAFFAAAERTWLEQPGPPLWLRYYKDEDQDHIYPAPRRAELREALARAGRAAVSDVTRARVAFTAAGFAVTEAYWDFAAARAAASKAARSGMEPAALLDAWKKYRGARERFTTTFAATRARHPLAMADQDLSPYLRNEPDSRLAAALRTTPAGRAALADSSAALLRSTVGVEPAELDRLDAAGAEALDDPGWRNVAVRPVGPSNVSQWTLPGTRWMGQGEAWQGRTVELREEAGGRRVLRITGCRTEDLGQWLPAEPGATYAAGVDVKARVSPGTATHLIVSFLDERGRHMGPGRVDRLPAGDGEQATRLHVIAKAPPGARWVGFGLRVLNQINDDFAEFSGASLRRAR